MDKGWTYVAAAMTVVMGIATVLLGITVPTIWGMSKDIGKLEARFDGFEKRSDAVDRKLDSIDSKVEAIGRRVDGIDGRLAQRETDPASLVAQSGLRPDSEFGGVRVGQKLYVLPKTDKAATELASSGRNREAITPSTFGYVVGTFDSAGRLQITPATVGGSGGSTTTTISPRQ